MGPEAPLAGRYRPLASHEVDAIVDHSFDILASIGMAGTPGFLNSRLLEAGARERSDGRLRLPRQLVERSLQRSPTSVDLPGFVEARGLTIGGAGVHVGAGGAAVQTLDAGDR